MNQKKMMMVHNLLLIMYLLVLSYVSGSMEYNNTDEGLVQGLLSDCPGSWLPSKIRPETLKRLRMAVLSNGNIITAQWPLYNYYRTKEIVDNLNFDIRKKTLLYVGGYGDSPTWLVGRMLGLLYKQMNYNVLLLDTLHFTATTFTRSSRLMRPVGKHAAEMLATLTKLGMNPKNLTLIGLSLGGQTVSFIAKNYRQITGRNVSTVIALDAAGPCFRHLGPDQILNQSDADFVLSVVTNSEGFGLGIPVGTVTVYVNGGEWQPGEISYMPCGIMCSHMRAYFIWLSALMTPHRFIAVRCDSVAEARNGDCYDRQPLETNTLDLYIDRSKPGVYYLATSNRWPYSLGKRGLKKRGKDAFVPVVTTVV